MAIEEAERRGAAIARVRSLLVAARTVADDPSIVDPLIRSTGLSREGVTRALRLYLETDATDAELLALMTTARPASRVHVILSANVFTAALRALAVAWASSEQVTVRPSQRDPVFASALVHALGDARLALAETFEPSRVREGEIHVYGRDETVAAVANAAPTGVVVRGHGAGMGVAFVDAGASDEVAARGIAEDVVVFDQRGCLSPRVVLVEGDAERAGRVAEALAGNLTTLGREVPRGRLDDDERRASARYVDAMAFAGTVLEGEGFAIGVGEMASPVLLPPTGRHVHVVAVRGWEEGRRQLAGVARFVVAVGCEDATAGRSLVEGRIRVSRLGRMQRPPLDGPVDLRALEHGIAGKAGSPSVAD
jgi:hypothetical protein